jgi:hypothetical protein
MKWSLVILCLCVLSLSAQNDLRIVTTGSHVLQVEYKGKWTSAFPQAEVLVRDVMGDTIHIRIRIGSEDYPYTLYMLDRGNPTAGMEFLYKVHGDGKLGFLACMPSTRNPDPIVPGVPQVDTSKKMKNARLGNLCELKEGNPVFFNNAPAGAICRTAMPPDFMAYVRYLMNNQQPNNRQRLVSEIIKNNCLSVQQLMYLLTYVELETEKVKTIREACPHIVNKEDLPQLASELKYQSAKDAVLEIAVSCKKDGALLGCRTPSPPDVLAEWWEKMQSVNTDSKRLELVKQQAPTVCLTYNQLRNTLRIFELDAERLDAAAVLIPRCIEKSRAGELLDLFVMPTYRKEYQALYKKLLQTP